MKKCSRCKNLLPRSAFYMDKRASDGLRESCKACVCALGRAYYSTDEYRKISRERARRLRADPDYRERDRANLRAWRERNPEQYRAQCERNNAKARGRRKGLRKRDEAGRAKHTAYENKRRARLLDGRSPGVSPEEWRGILEQHGHRCAYCGTGGKLTREHCVPISRGGVDAPENVVPACQPCNSRKKNRTADEYRAYLARLEAA